MSLMLFARTDGPSFVEDVDIWHNKFRVDNPLLCDGDGPLHKLREWYDQFYVDRGDVPKQEKSYYASYRLRVILSTVSIW